MKGRKNILSACTAIVFAVSAAVSASVLPAYADGDWDGTVDTSWYNTTDTEFTLTTPEELAGLAEIVNSGKDNFADKFVYMGNDISFYDFADAEAWKKGVGTPEHQWESIGIKYETPFKGTFCGNNYTISGLYSYDDDNKAGLFGYAGSGSSIQNVVLSDSYLCSINDFAGGICAYVRMATVTDCENRAVVESTYYTAGGICGANLGGALEKCSNSGTIYGQTGAGGVAGEICSTGTANNCFNSGTVTSVKAAGGISGLSSENGIKNCYNMGNITGGTETGGIIGKSTGDSKLSSCYNFGTVISQKGTSGGVTGSEKTVCTSCYYLEALRKAQFSAMAWKPLIPICLLTASLPCF